jgi:hypothetical protein
MYDANIKKVSIQTAEDVRDVMEFLNPAQRAVVYAANKNNMPLWIKTIKDLLNILEYLNIKQRTVVCIDCETLFPTLSGSVKDVIGLLKHLYKAFAVFESEIHSLVAQLPALIVSYLEKFKKEYQPEWTPGIFAPNLIDELKNKDPLEQFIYIQYHLHCNPDSTHTKVLREESLAVAIDEHKEETTHQMNTNLC